MDVQMTQEDSAVWLESLAGLIRKKTFKRRAAGRLRWHITGGMQIGVQVSVQMESRWPAADGGFIWENVLASLTACL